ncbi:GNAT family N-acetyltransferase [Micromonospora sp. NPDC005299]|uniref:GNAT family N-acetyltransferase n=1 Tax=Micromonospora sp. NPDC005299 TaxID=3364231 RepID=UPI0036B70465
MILQITPLIDPAHSSSGYRLAWLATGVDGRPLGTAFLRVPATGGVADLELQVHPAERRANVGTRLLETVNDAATDLGMRGLLTEPVRQGAEGDHFCRAHGLRQVLALTYTRLPLDGDTLVNAPVSGYRLIHWEGTVPDELANTFARSRRAMDDMPMDDAAYVPQPWDVERLHAVADAVARRGEILCTTAAVAADGEIAGFTELVVPGDGTGDGQHYGTGVLAEHRGRGLARWMKVEQITRTRNRFPRLAGLLADTADSNTAMRRINDSFGYRPTHRSLLYQLDLTSVT